VHYLEARRNHFRVTVRQLGGFFFFAALANAGGLAAGGWQVLSGTMTLGQLVAAQLILNLIITGLDKVVRKSGDFFDLLTGLDKVGHVTDLAVERVGGRELPLTDLGARVRCRQVRFAYYQEAPVLNQLDFDLREGERVSLVGASGAGKSTLAALLCGLEEPSFGSIEIDGIDVREVDLASLRRSVALAGYERELFDGTVEENVRIGREYVTHEDVRWALEMCELTEDIALMPRGLDTMVVSNGLNLSRGQVQRLLIARAIVDRPRLLILDEAFTGIDERIASRILDRIFDTGNRWSIIDISHEPEVVVRTETIYVLADGHIKEQGSPDALASDPTSEFSQLFPYLCAGLRMTSTQTQEVR
jgi:ATP-binding cassette subfamily B protein